MNHVSPAFRILIRALLITCLSTSASALSSDRDQPLHIQSNSAESQRNEGITIYQGDVEIRQGSMRISAQKVTIYSSNNEINRIVAVGAPAHYQQTPSEDKATVVARANTIEYLIDQEKLNLLINASLTQDGSLLQGEIINYDIKAAAVKAAGGTNSNDERVHVIIPPKNKDTNN